MGLFKIFTQNKKGAMEQKILNNIDKEKLNRLCASYGISDISDYLMGLINENSEFMDALLEQYFPLDLFFKINNGSCELKDISFNYRWVIKYLKFSEEEQKIVDVMKPIIEKNIDSSGEDLKDVKERYYALNCDDLENVTVKRERVIDKIESFFEDTYIIKSDKEVIPVISLFQSNAKMKILTPVCDKKIKIVSDEDGWDEQIYIDDEIRYTKDTIIIVKYDDFLKLASNPEIFAQISDCQFVFEEDYVRVGQLYDLAVGMMYQEDISLDMQSSEELIVKINHFLYVINNSDLERDKKEFYTYRVKELYSKLSDNDLFRSYQANYDLQALATKIQQELGLDVVENLTDQFNDEDDLKKIEPITAAEYNANIFIFGIDNFGELSDEMVLKKIANLSEENLVKILNDKRIINKLSRYVNETEGIETIIQKIKKEIQLLRLDLNHTTISFIRSHNIDVDKFLTLPQSHIYSTSEINPIVKNYVIKKKQERTELSIGEIIGYDGHLGNWDRNILDFLRNYQTGISISKMHEKWYS